MKTAKGVFPFLMVMAFSLAIVGSTAMAQQKFVLKFNHVLGPSEPYHLGFQKWAKAVDEKTKGGLKIEVFHSAQLGVEEDIIEQIRRGANIGQNTDSARMGNYVPGIAVMNGPYFAENLDEVAKLMKSPTVRGWGIGKAIASALLREGAKVALVDVDGARLETAKKELRGKAGSRIAIPIDITKNSQVTKMVAEVLNILEGSTSW